MISRKIALIVLVAIVLNLLGCSSGSSPGVEGLNNTTSLVMGNVYLDDSTQITMIEFYDTAGNKLGQSATDLSEYGTFFTSVNNLPANFEIRAIIADSTRFAANGQIATLKAYVENFNAEEDFITVNVVTTIVVAYMAKHPEMNYEEALAAVKNYLELPEDYDIEYVSGDPMRYFYTPAFMFLAGECGGVDNLISILVEGIDAEGTYPITENVLHAGSGNLGEFSFAAAGKFVGGSLASGAVAYVGGALMGMAFQAMGIDFGSQGDLKELSKKLDMIAQKIDTLGAELKQEMYKYHNAGTYNTLVTGITPVTSNISSWSDTMKVYTESAGRGEKVDPAKIDNLTNTILANAGYLNHLHKFQIGESTIGLPSAMQTMQTIICERYYCNDHYWILKKQFDAIQGYQLQMLNLLTSADTRGCPPDLTIAQSRYVQYWKNIRQQFSMLPQPLSNDSLILDKKNNIIWTRKPIGRAQRAWEAQALADRYKLGTYKNWRLPTIQELMSLGKWSDIKDKGFQDLDSIVFARNSIVYILRDGKPFPLIGYFTEPQRVILVHDNPEPRLRVEDTEISSPYNESCEEFAGLGSRTVSSIQLSMNMTSTRGWKYILNPGFYWQSSDESVATVINEPGTGDLRIFADNSNCPEGKIIWKQTNTPVTITASRWLWGTYESFTLDITGDKLPTQVEQPILVKIGVYPQNKRYITLPSRVQYYATGIYSDNTYRDLTGQVTWSSTGNASFDTHSSYEGCLTVNSYTADTQTVTATYQGVTGTTQYKVPAAP